MADKTQGEMENSPIEEVRLTVPTTDDKDLPVLTFRTWILGPLGCAFLAFSYQIFGYRQNQIVISGACVQLVVLLAGKLMASVLPTKLFTIPGTKWTFSLNPGPFNIKEHVLITLFVSTGSDSPYASILIPQMKVFYHRKIHSLAAFLMMQTTQLMGYGFAGLVMKLLIDSPYMWWPSCLVDVASYRALHEGEKRSKGGLSRLQFFIIASVSSFAYYIVPGYFFQSITALSFICWIWKSSVTAQQIGAGYQGLGLGSFGLDWATVSFMGSPLASPGFTILNFFAGFVVFLYIIVPIAYWTNAYDAKRFPIFSQRVFDASGHKYNISRVLNSTTFQFDHKAYNSYSKMYMSTATTYAYGFSFASLTATLVHVALYNGKSIWRQFRDAYGKEGTTSTADIHTRLMKKNYATIPQWWFFAILLSMVTLSIFTVEGFGGQLQLPYWGILLCTAMILILILPLGVITATTNMWLELNILSEMIIGYIYPGKPIAAIAFKSYGLSAMDHALSFLYDFKLGHYMKIPPRSMFLVQVFATVISSSVNFATAWWLFSTVENICDPDKLPLGSPWTCPGQNTVNSNINLWGVIGPAHIFAPDGIYSNVYYFFLVGALATLLVWLLSRMTPKNKWIKDIHVPVILMASAGIPRVMAVNYWSWFVVGFVFNIVIYRRCRRWWTRYNYVLSSALDAGVAFLALLLSVLQFQGVYGITWWGEDVDDHCPLAHCPTAPGVVVEGCPVFH